MLGNDFAVANCPNIKHAKLECIITNIVSREQIRQTESPPRKGSIVQQKGGAIAVNSTNIPYINENSTNSQWAEMPAMRPPTVWEAMALDISWR